MASWMNSSQGGSPNNVSGLQTGFALPLVLMILAFLTALAFGLTRTVSANTKLLQERKSAWAEEMLVRDTVEQIALTLLVGAYDPEAVSQATVRLPLNNTPVSVNGLTIRVQSWSGLYSLSLIGYENVNPVLDKLMDKKTAQQVSAEIADWVDQDNRRRFRGREVAGYVSDRMDMRPRNAPLRSIDEFLEIPSVTTAMMNGTNGNPGLRDLFLAGGEDNFDLGTAPEILIGPVLRVSEFTVREIIEARKNADWAKVRFLVDDNHWTNNDHPSFYKGLKYRVMVETSRSVTSRVQIELTPNNPHSPYAIIDWQVPDYPYE